MGQAKRRPAKKTRKSARAEQPRTKKERARPGGGSDIESLARRIVRTARLPSMSAEEIRALYNEDCTSEEAAGGVVVGYDGLEEKRKRWERMRASERLSARNVWTSRNTICIEWDWEVELCDGPALKLREIAVHEIKNGKIQSERFYYNPMAFAPPPDGRRPRD